MSHGMGVKSFNECVKIVDFVDLFTLIDISSPHNDDDDDDEHENDKVRENGELNENDLRKITSSPKIENSSEYREYQHTNNQKFGENLMNVQKGNDLLMDDILSDIEHPKKDTQSVMSGETNGTSIPDLPPE